MITEQAAPASNAHASWLAWPLWGISVILAAFGIFFLILNGSFASLIGDDSAGINASVAVAFPTVGAIIASRRPGNPIGWIFCSVGLFQGIALFADQYARYALLTAPGALPAGVVAGWLGTWSWLPGVGLTTTFLLLLFPHGRFPSRRWLPVAWLAVMGIALGVVSLAIAPWDMLDVYAPADNPLQIEGARAVAIVLAISGLVLLMISTLLCLVALVSRFHRSRGEEREQLKWFAYASILTVASLLLALIPPLYYVGSFLQIVAIPLLPVATGIAVLRYRLYDIDIIINRTLVYGALTACVVGLYVLVVGYLGALFQTSGNLAISLVATGIIAVIFQPLRERLQRGANSLMYGERDDPYGVISRLGRRLEGTLAPEAVLPTIVDDVARALRLPQAGIWLTDGDTLRLEASHGEAPTQTTALDAGAVEKLRHAPDGLRPTDLDPSGEYGTVLAESGAALVLPLTHRGELVGALSLAPRSPGEEFSPADRRLLRDRATQAGAAAHAVRLTVALRSSLEELRRSRERLVAAQEEERRRIQRDLHDGLGPILASMRLRLEACLDTQTNGGPSEAPLAEDLERLYELVGQATGDIRRLVHDLRPPVLDQLGLVPALRQHCERFHRETGIVVNFEAEENLPVPAAAEAAILRVAQESLLNVEKHARASRVDVRLERGDGWISLEVRDDGVGMDESLNGAAGTGIVGMRERADLLGGEFRISASPGGGTEVAMRIPAPDREAVK
ncbi:MAG: histidine kinase [Rubrobacteraceae bacterium]